MKVTVKAANNGLSTRPYEVRTEDEGVIYKSILPRGYGGLGEITYNMDEEHSILVFGHYSVVLWYNEDGVGQVDVINDRVGLVWDGRRWGKFKWEGNRLCVIE